MNASLNRISLNRCLGMVLMAMLAVAPLRAEVLFSEDFEGDVIGEIPARAAKRQHLKVESVSVVDAAAAGATALGSGKQLKLMNDAQEEKSIARFSPQGPPPGAGTLSLVAHVQSGAIRIGLETNGELGPNFYITAAGVVAYEAPNGWTILKRQVDLRGALSIVIEYDTAEYQYRLTINGAQITDEKGNSAFPFRREVTPDAICILADPSNAEPGEVFVDNLLWDAR